MQQNKTVYSASRAGIEMSIADWLIDDEVKWEERELCKKEERCGLQQTEEGLLYGQNEMVGRRRLKTNSFRSQNAIEDGREKLINDVIGARKGMWCNKIETWYERTIWS